MPPKGKRKATITSNATPSKALKQTGKTDKTKEEKTTSKYFSNPVHIGDTASNKKANLQSPSTISASNDGAKAGRLGSTFYAKSCEDLAKALLGQKVVSMVDGRHIVGKIVETEAYIGPIDRAAHSYNGKRTARNEAMYMQPGTAYVYNIYGTYCCLNISSEGDGAAVLIRALEPVDNLETMDKLRTKGKPGNSLMKKNGRELCNGPSKLCQALGIKKDSHNQLDLCKTDLIYLVQGEIIEDDKIVKCKRINIGYAEDWKDKPLRFYVLGNDFVSVKDKMAENEMKG